MQTNYDIIFLSEHFIGWQGEGINIGMKTKFIRFKNCNMQPRCIWCDTKSVMDNPPITVTLQELEETMLTNIVFTGGEPLLYQKEIIQIIEHFHNFDNITIETNGTIFPSIDFIDTIVMNSKTNLFSVSPKFNHINEKVIEKFSCYSSQFKFVISNPDEIKIVNELHKIIGNRPIILQPVYYPEYTLSEYLDKVKELYDIAPDYCRVIPQMQHILYGNKTGV